MAADIETAVIGAGAVGLAIAQRLARAGHEVLVLERHGRIGAETSSRNSEVIHAGLYYAPGSLKARLSVSGREMLYRFADENGVTARRLGKLLVAVDAGEAPQLERIAHTAAANGVTDLTPLTAAEARALEPEVACVAALLSPSTGILDSHGYMTALEGHLDAAGGRIVLNTTVHGLTRTPDGLFAIETESEGTAASFTANNLVLAAGLGATPLGRQLLAPNPGYEVPETYYAKGHYFTLAGPAPFSRLVYPLPTRGSLGIHFTRDAGGAGRFGPDIEWTGGHGGDPPDYGFDDPVEARRAAFEAAIRRYWPAIPAGALHPAYTGIRPKLTREGAPAADFAIHGEAAHGIPRFVALYGIESPGLTSSLAIGEHVAALLGA